MGSFAIGLLTLVLAVMVGFVIMGLFATAAGHGDSLAGAYYMMAGIASLVPTTIAFGVVMAVGAPGRVVTRTAIVLGLVATAIAVVSQSLVSSPIDPNWIGLVTGLLVLPVAGEWLVVRIYRWIKDPLDGPAATQGGPPS